MDHQFKEKLQRMLEIAKTKNGAGLARILGISPQSISGWHAKQEIPPGAFLSLSEKTKASIDYLVHGVGRPYLPTPEDKIREIREAEENRHVVTRITTDLDRQMSIAEEFVFIRQMSGKISAGGGLQPDNSADVLVAFRKDWIRTKGSPEKMSLIRVAGDSMEPTLCPGDLVLIDHGRNYIDPHGGIYALAVDHGIVVKRVHVAFSQEKLRIVSDNRIYDPVEVDADQINVNGKVIWYAREMD